MIMNVEGKRFLEKLYNECQVRFNQKRAEDDGETLQELLLNRIERAANQGIISEPIQQQITNGIGRLKERSITQLTPAERDKVLAVLQAAYPKTKK